MKNEYTKNQLDARYGGANRLEIGKCIFSEDGHYYMQRETDLLHLKDGIINNVHNSVIDSINCEVKEITKQEFNDKLNSVLLELCKIDLRKAKIDKINENN